MNDPYAIFSIIDNPTRVQLIVCLGDQEKTVSSLITTCGLSQSAVSQHLQKLRLAGAVSCRKDGREMFYSVREPRILSICRLVVAYMQDR